MRVTLNLYMHLFYKSSDFAGILTSSLDPIYYLCHFFLGTI